MKEYTPLSFVFFFITHLCPDYKSEYHQYFNQKKTGPGHIFEFVNPEDNKEKYTLELLTIIFGFLFLFLGFGFLLH